MNVSKRGQQFGEKAEICDTDNHITQICVVEGA